MPFLNAPLTLSVHTPEVGPLNHYFYIDKFSDCTNPSTKFVSFIDQSCAEEAFFQYLEMMDFEWLRHYDFYSMWEDHIEQETHQTFLDERYCPDYRTDQERYHPMEGSCEEEPFFFDDDIPF